MVKHQLHKEPRLPVNQLIILSICRFAEPVALTSVFPYLPEMIESFNVPKNDVPYWAGITSAVFSFSQCLTGIAWGRASDVFGRKRTILLGLSCTMTACLLFGFSRTLVWAIVARSLAGASSGTVGIIRTTVAEMVPEKSLQPRAFSIMPLVWSIGAIVGPIFGGALANPARTMPKIFDTSFFREFPFSLPNLVAAIFFTIGLTSGFLFLKETLETRKHDRDIGRTLGYAIRSTCCNSRRRKYPKWKEVDEHTPLLASDNAKVKPSPPSYSEIFSPQSNLNLLAYTLLALHSVAFDQLVPVFLHLTPQEDRSTNPDVSFPFKFSGGFGLESDRIGLIFTLYGIVAMFLQFGVFPPVARNFGVLNSLRACTILFPIAYILLPFTVLMPTPITQQVAIFCVMLIKCLAGVFAFPCTTILLTNSARSLRLLGTLNGVATSISAIGRAIGPSIAGGMFTYGIDIGFVILPWWTLAAFAIIGHIPTWWLVELDAFGSGSETESEHTSDSEHSPSPTKQHETFEPDQEPSSSDPIPVSTDRRGSTIHTISEEHDTSAVEDGAPLFASPEADRSLSRITSRSSRSRITNRSSRRASPREAQGPFGMKDIGPGKGRKLSTNLGLSEGLGRTAIGGGFGTRGPEFEFGSFKGDRELSQSRSRSRARDS